MGELIYSGFVLKRANPDLSTDDVRRFVYTVFTRDPEIYRYGKPNVVRFPEPSEKIGSLILIEGVMLPYDVIRARLTNRKLGGWTVYLLSPDFGIKRNPLNGEMEHQHVLLHNEMMRGHGFLPLINIFHQDFALQFGDIVSLSEVALIGNANQEQFSQGQLSMLHSTGRVNFIGNTTPRMPKHQKKWKPTKSDYSCMEVLFWTRLEALQAHYLLNRNASFSSKPKQFVTSVDGRKQCSFNQCAGLGIEGEILKVEELLEEHKYIPISSFREGIISEDKLAAFTLPCRYCEKPYKIVGISAQLNWLAATCSCDTFGSKYTWGEDSFFRLVPTEKDLKNFNRFGNVPPGFNGLHRLIMPMEARYQSVDHFRKTGLAAASSSFKLTKLSLHENQTKGVVEKLQFIEERVIKGKLRHMYTLEVIVAKEKLWCPDGLLSMRGATLAPVIKDEGTSISYNIAKNDKFVKAVIDDIQEVSSSPSHSRVVLLAAFPRDNHLQIGQEVVVIPKPPNTEHQSIKRAVAKWRNYRDQMEHPKPTFSSAIMESSHLTSTTGVYGENIDVWSFEFQISRSEEMSKVKKHLSRVYFACDVEFKIGTEILQTTARIIGLHELQNEKFAIQGICKVPEGIILKENQLLNAKFWLIFSPRAFDSLVDEDDTSNDEGSNNPEENDTQFEIENNKEEDSGSEVGSDKVYQEAEGDQESENNSDSDQDQDEKLEDSDGEMDDEEGERYYISPDLQEFREQLLAEFQKDFEEDLEEEEEEGDNLMHRAMQRYEERFCFEKMELADSYLDAFYKCNHSREVQKILRDWKERPAKNLAILDFLLEAGPTVNHSLKVNEVPMKLNVAEDEQKEELLNYSMNKFQVDATDKFIENRISITQGPPGTGKTSTIALGVAKLHMEKKGLIAVTAPSNYATNVAYEKISKVNERFELGMKIVRMRSEKRERKELRKCKNLKDLDPNLLHVQVRKHPLWSQSSHINRLLKKRRTLGNARLLAEERMQIRIHERKIVTQILAEADVVISTVGCATDTRLEGALKICKEIGKQLSGLVIDEASLLPVTSIIPVLTLEPNRVWVVGDCQQLRATVLDNSAKDAGLEVSWMEYLTLIPAMRDREIFTMLQIQYRMAAPISNVISNLMYCGRVKSSALVLKRDYTENPVHCNFPEMKDTNVGIYSYQDYAEKREGDSYSIFNLFEVDITRSILQKLKRSGQNLSEVVIIAMYDAQVVHLKNMLREMGTEYSEVRAATVDSMQGHESGIIIINMVRSNRMNDIGFLRFSQRNNVGFSRAKNYLFVVGDMRTLWGSKVPDMQTLLMEIATEKAMMREFKREGGKLVPKKLVPLEEHIIALFPDAQEKFDNKLE